MSNGNKNNNNYTYDSGCIANVAEGDTAPPQISYQMHESQQRWDSMASKTIRWCINWIWRWSKLLTSPHYIYTHSARHAEFIILILRHTLRTFFDQRSYRRVTKTSLVGANPNVHTPHSILSSPQSNSGCCGMCKIEGNLCLYMVGLRAVRPYWNWSHGPGVKHPGVSWPLAQRHPIHRSNITKNKNHAARTHTHTCQTNIIL